MKLLIPAEAGIFCPLETGHLLASKDIAGGEFVIGEEINLSTMFKLYTVSHKGEAVGYYLYSGFKVMNKGGVLVTYLETKKGMATTGTCVFRSPALTVYDIPACGSIAISPKVNDRIVSIFNEQ